MITEWEVYWITRCDDMKTLLVGLTIFASFGIIFLIGANIIFSFGENDEGDERIHIKLKRYLAVFLIPYILILLGAVLMPDTKEMCAIKIIPAIVNNERVQEFPDKIFELANEWMEELKPEKE